MKHSAQTIIEKCGGHGAVAQMLGVSLSTVHRWTYPKSRRGTGGLIPTQRQCALIFAARARGIALTAADFFPVAESDDLADPPHPVGAPREPDARPGLDAAEAGQDTEEDSATAMPEGATPK